MTVASPVHWSADVLRFWFETMTEQQWWASTPELDETIRERFIGVSRQAADSDISLLTDTARTSLAAVIALDQFPRNMYRRMPEAFATDAKALRVAEAAVAKRQDAELTPTERSFLYMPYMHAEDAATQSRALTLFTALGLENSIRAAHEHKAIIDRFGRFPHRNAALGRVNSADEEAYLADAKRYGQ